MVPSNFGPVYDELVGLIGEENTLKIYDRFKGQIVSFPEELFSEEFIKSTKERKHK